jgi:hypothetical protein
MGVKWLVACPSCTLPWERTSATDWTGSWMSLRGSLKTEARGKILYPCQGLNPGHPVRSQTLYWLRYSGYYYSCNYPVSGFMFCWTKVSILIYVWATWCNWISNVYTTKDFCTGITTNTITITNFLKLTTALILIKSNVFYDWAQGLTLTIELNKVGFT